MDLLRQSRNLSINGLLPRKPFGEIKQRTATADIKKNRTQINDTLLKNKIKKGKRKKTIGNICSDRGNFEALVICQKSLDLHSC